MFLVKEFYRNENSINHVQKKYEEQFGPHDIPPPQTIHRLVQLFEETGSVMGPESWLTTLHESHLRDEKPPLGSTCWWSSEDSSTAPADPGDTN